MKVTNIGQARSSRRRRAPGPGAGAAATGLSLVGGTMPSLTGTPGLMAGGGRAGLTRDRCGLPLEGGRGTSQACTPPQRAATTGTPPTGTPPTLNRGVASPSSPVVGGILTGGAWAHAEAKEENIRCLEMNANADKMKSKMTTPSKKVKTVSKPRRKKTLAGSPLPKRLNPKTRALYSPLKNLSNQAANNSQDKKNNFNLLLNSWELISSKNLTPAVLEKPRMIENCGQPIPGNLRKIVEKLGRPSSV
jgi:hypothetical protein